MELAREATRTDDAVANPMGADAQNRLRFDASSDRGHVESYFVRANHPSEPLALWLKATILKQEGRQPIAEVSCVFFDGRRQRRWAAKKSVPLNQTEFGGTPLQVSLDGCHFLFGPEGGEAKGSLSNEEGSCSWDISWQAAENALGAPLCLFPWSWMVDGGFPRSKLLTPLPLSRFAGSLLCDDREIELESWLGMQGHNWGREHSHQYVWGQCIFNDSHGEPHCMVEAFSGRLKIAGMVTPYISSLVVRRGDETYRFDQLFALWRQQPQIDDLQWRLRTRGPDGSAILTMRAEAADVACLGYRNPDGSLRYCLNSKLAETTLRLFPVNGDAFSCSSAHGGALEFLQPEPHPLFPHPI